MQERPDKQASSLCIPAVPGHFCATIGFITVRCAIVSSTVECYYSGHHVTVVICRDSDGSSCCPDISRTKKWHYLPIVRYLECNLPRHACHAYGVNTFSSSNTQDTVQTLLDVYTLRTDPHVLNRLRSRFSCRPTRSSGRNDSWAS